MFMFCYIPLPVQTSYFLAGTLTKKVFTPSAATAAPAAAATPDPAAPKDVLQALEQRQAKYAEASTQAKASGDDRKARMHDRIAKARCQKLKMFQFLN